MRDIKPVFAWAKELGDANIYDRILVKTLPTLLAANIQLTSEEIDQREQIEVSDHLYALIKQVAEALVDQRFRGEV